MRKAKTTASRGGARSTPQKRDDDAEDDGAEEGGPPGDACGAVEDVGLDDEAVEDGDEGVEAEEVAEAVPVVAFVDGEEEGEDGADKAEGGADAGDELAESANEGPERCPGDVQEPEADPPEEADNKGVEGGGLPPAEERAAYGAKGGP